MVKYYYSNGVCVCVRREKSIHIHRRLYNVHNQEVIHYRQNRLSTIWYSLNTKWYEWRDIFALQFVVLNDCFFLSRNGKILPQMKCSKLWQSRNVFVLHPDLLEYVKQFQMQIYQNSRTWKMVSVVYFFSSFAKWKKKCWYRNNKKWMIEGWNLFLFNILHKYTHKCVPK